MYREKRLCLQGASRLQRPETAECSAAHTETYKQNSLRTWMITPKTRSQSEGYLKEYLKKDFVCI